MKWLILNTDYPGFLCWLYAQHGKLENLSYDEQMRARVESLFGVADFYSSNLRKLGHEAHDIHANNEWMQKAWAQEHSLKVEHSYSWSFRLRRGIVPWVSRVTNQRWFYDILAAQIQDYKPDVLLNHDMCAISSSFLKEIKPYVRLLVGQIASPLPETQDFSCYDLILSSLPNFVDHFRHMGLSAELHRLAFEPRILNHLTNGNERIPVSFVGSLSPHHEARIQLLEYLCNRLEVHVWAQGVEHLPEHSSIRRCYKGRAWGVEMYQILQNSNVTINHHIDIAESYANNMRLFEATGVGTLLITDWKVNLKEMFEPGTEVVTYRSPEECTEMIQYYLAHEDEREAIARAGQQRTLREHTFYQRMQELEEVVHKYF
jgi:spore maturation protein CgeB